MAEWSPSDFRLEGARALVVGASRGIGRACALGLAASGADVAVASRDRQALDETANGVEAHGRDAQVLACEVESDHDVERLFRTVGELDILVYSAGVNAPAPLVEMSAEKLDWMLAINLRAAYRIAQEAVRKMLAARRGGRIIFISSQMGHVGAANRTAYCATKHGLEGLAKAMAVELAPSGIRVVTVAPTFIETELTAAFFEDAAFLESVLNRIPLGRLGTVADVVGAVVFAASPASSLLTGSSVRVDGGWTAQ